MQIVNQCIQLQFNRMQATGHLFRSSITGDQVWESYLKNFKEGDDPIFRDPNSTTHNCNYCCNFIRRYGNVVAIYAGPGMDFHTMTIWDCWKEVPEEYRASFQKMHELVSKAPIADIFVETKDMLAKLAYPQSYRNRNLWQLGVDYNVKRYTREEAEKFGVVKPNQIIKFEHIYLVIQDQFINKTGESRESLEGQARSVYQVFKRGLEGLNKDTLALIIDLINQDSILDGRAHLNKVKKFKEVLEQYLSVPPEVKDNWIWYNSVTQPLGVTRFKNELIGVLATELAMGKELNEACRSFNMRVDPANYMKAKAPITQRMIDEANKFIQEEGYNESFHRRMATIDDIKAHDILHMNVGDGGIKAVSVLDGIKPTSTRHKKSEFDGVEEVPIEKFMKDILPNCTSVEVFLQNSQKKNFVSITAPMKEDSKPIMKWDNNFSWTYNGNLAGVSQIREEVKKAGGFVDAPFRFSIMWNEDGRDLVDLDAHCIEPDRTEIYFSSYKGHRSPNGGMLDVDMIRPSSIGVENIFWSGSFSDGCYHMFIHNYDHGDFKNCKAEIFINGESYQYFVPEWFRNHCMIAKVYISGGEVDHIEHSEYLVDSNAVSSEIYGLETNKFHKVNLICLSPNHWTNKIGNKHYFFMLEGAKAPESIRGFHNENLRQELLDHRKVMEVLGSQLRVESTDKQLSGLGFDETVRNEVILRLKGSFNRVIKVKF